MILGGKKKKEELTTMRHIFPSVRKRQFKVTVHTWIVSSLNDGADISQNKTSDTTFFCTVFSSMRGNAQTLLLSSSESLSIKNI